MRAKITGIIAVLMLAFTVQAQEPSAPSGELQTPPADVNGTVAAKPDAAAEEMIETVAVESDSVAGASMKGGLISLSLKEVELNNVIRLFATLSDANIIIPDIADAAGAVKVDVNLRNVEWKPALQSILDTQGLELFEKIPGTQVYSVRKKLADAPEPMSMKTFKLNYATVGDVGEMIKGMVPGTGKISIFPARNTIVVQSTPENLVEIETMIAAVDLPRQQVFIEAKFLELGDSASKKLGIDWQVLGGYNVGINDVSGSYSYSDSKKDSSNKGRNNYTDIAGRPYEKLTERPDDPIVSPFDGSLVNGVDYPRRPESTGANDTRVYGITPTDLSEITSVDAATVTKALGATLSASDFNLVLAALKETGGTKVVSNPKVIVANEETAIIHIGKKKPNVRGTTQTAGDSQSITTYALDDKEPYFEDGIKVNVTPTINTASNITVKIQPTLDRLDTIPYSAPDGTVFYGKSTKTITTLFSLENGQTAAIGGLTQTSDDEVDRKVPLLGSIPLIGRLFSYSAKIKDQAETIIFVTVGLANSGNVNMETGLPEESSLTMRHNAKMKADRQIKAQELKLIETQETERVQAAIQKLQAAEQKRLQEKK